MSNIVKKIRVKQSDGSFSDYIPIGADALNVNTKKGESVQSALDKTARYYNSVEEMRTDNNLQEEDKCVTLGYYEPNDGGGAEYKIINDDSLEDDGGSIIALNNGLKAQLIVVNQINVKQFGAKGDKQNDDTIAIQKALDFYKNVFIPNGTYNVTQLTINKYQFLHGCGRNSVIQSTLDNTDNDIFAIIIPASSDRIILKDFRVNGGIDNATTGTATEQDVNNTFENLVVGSGYGFKVHQRGNYLKNIRCGSTKYGIHVTGTDNTIESCVTAVTDSHGIWIAGANNNVNNSKSFIAGNKEYGIGFFITGAFTRMNGCESQQNKYENYWIQNSYGTNISGCISDGAFYDNNIQNYQNTIVSQDINSSSIFLHNIKSCIVDIVNINGSFDTNPTEVLGFVYHSLISKSKLTINSYNRDNNHINVMSQKDLYKLCVDNSCVFNGINFNEFTNIKNYFNQFITSFEANNQVTNKIKEIHLPLNTKYLSIRFGEVGDKTNLASLWVDCICIVVKDGVTKYEVTSQNSINSNSLIGINVANFLTTIEYDSITDVVCRVIAINKTNVEAFTFEINDIIISATEGELPNLF